MLSFEKLFETVLSQSTLDRDALLKLIEEKKRRVGAGYLTDQGALFLVAADLGISLDHATSSDTDLSDLYVGANEVTAVGRIFAIYPPRRYVGKNGSEGLYRRLVLFDKEAFVKVTLWKEKAHSIENLGLKIGDAIRVVKGYVKSGLDGRAVLHVGERGEVEVVKDQDTLSKLPTIVDIVKKVDEIITPNQHLAVVGLLKSPPKLSNFVRKDGRPGSVIQIYLTNSSGEKSLRVAIWNNESVSLQQLPLNSTVRLINVKGRLLPHGEIELHGDESTQIEVLSIGEARVESRPISGVKVFRLLSIGMAKEREEVSSGTALVVDELGRFQTLVARGDTYQRLLELDTDTVFQCNVRELGETAVVCEDAESIEVIDEARDLLDTSSIKVKVNKVRDISIPVILEVIALSRPSLQEVVTKEGSTVKRAEVVVGDETGEVKIVAWRNLVRLLEEIMPGERLLINGLIVKLSRDGNPFLLVRSYTSIKKVTQ